MIQASSTSSRTAAASIIAHGGVIAFLTDTFYGLGADPINAAAVKTIRELKGREEQKPILLLISDLNELERFIANQSDTFKEITRAFWPGALTIVEVACPGLPVELTAGTNTIGVRLPDDENVRALVRACGGALTATSANVSGSPAARNARQVQDYFSSGIDLIIDGGEATVTEASTVLDLSGTEARLIREGVIKRAKLERVIKLK